MAKKYKVPECPKCRAKLYEVYEVFYTRAIFDNETGEYEFDEYDDKPVIECPKCKNNLNKIFPDGLSNFKSKVEK
jgi:predicted nucleic-acid-binding Zn-ribbon protein